MSIIRKNIFANFVGSLWTMFMSIVFVPFYLRFMGMEAYGLVGFYAMLLSILSVVDLGLAATSQREMAYLSALPDGGPQLGSFVRTVEAPFWILGLLAALGMTLLSPVIAHHWLRTEQMSPATAQRAVALMGWAMAFRVPLNLYLGGLQGLERQVAVNVLTCTVVTLQGVGAVLVLRFVSSTIVAFFVWQVVIAFLQTAWAGILLRKHLPSRCARTQPRRQVLARVWRFAAATNADALVSFAAGQLDKVLLSKLLPLHVYAHYMLAWTMAACLLRLAGPVQSAIYPRYTRLVAMGDKRSLRSLYHETSQLVSVLAIPAAVVLGLFAPEVVLIWTRNADTAVRVAPILRLLAFGTGIGALFSMPTAMLLANGWVGLLLYAHIGALVFAAVAVPSFTISFGAIGGGFAWLLMNVGFVFIVVPIMHRRLLAGASASWLGKDIAAPLLASLVVGSVGRILTPAGLRAGVALPIVIAVSMFSLLAAVHAAPAMRRRALAFVGLR